MDNQNNRSNKNNPKNNRQGWGVILVTTLLTAFLVMGLFSLMQGSDPQEISYDKFLKMVDEKKVEKVTIDSAKIYITLTDEARKEAIKKNQEENTATAELLEQIEEKTAGGEREPDYYTGAVKDDTLSQRLYDAGVEYEQNIPDTIADIRSIYHGDPSADPDIPFNEFCDEEDVKRQRYDGNRKEQCQGIC